MHYETSSVKMKNGDDIQGNEFLGLNGITTTDALEFQMKYCKALDNVQFPSKPVKQCTTADGTGFVGRHIFEDRFCNGYAECLGGEDEKIETGVCKLSDAYVNFHFTFLTIRMIKFNSAGREISIISWTKLGQMRP